MPSPAPLDDRPFPTSSVAVHHGRGGPEKSSSSTPRRLRLGRALPMMAIAMCAVAMAALQFLIAMHPSSLGYYDPSAASATDGAGRAWAGARSPPPPETARPAPPGAGRGRLPAASAEKENNAAESLSSREPTGEDPSDRKAMIRGGAVVVAESSWGAAESPEASSFSFPRTPPPEGANATTTPPPPPPMTRIVWQTSRNSTLPPEARDYARTWRFKNPNWEVRVLSDEDVDDFFRTGFPEDHPRVYDAFRSLPLGVMKADMFRVGVLYRRGGVYADIDTECVVPLDEWMGEDDDGCEAYVGAEGTNLCNWAMAAPRPGHPVFERALYRIVEGAESYDGGSDVVKADRNSLVLAFTGPGSLTRAVAEVLGLERTIGPGREMRLQHRNRANTNAMSARKMLENAKAQAKAKKMKLCLKKKSFFSRDKVIHHYGAMMWNNSVLYKSWKREIKAASS